MIRILLAVVLFGTYSVACTDNPGAPNLEPSVREKCREYAEWQCEGPSGGGPGCVTNMARLCVMDGGPPANHEGFQPSWER
jgi:hypothetical protein